MAIVMWCDSGNDHGLYSASGSDSRGVNGDRKGDSGGDSCGGKLTGK